MIPLQPKDNDPVLKSLESLRRNGLAKKHPKISAAQLRRRYSLRESIAEELESEFFISLTSLLPLQPSSQCF